MQSEADFTRFQFKLPPPLTKPYGMPLVFSTRTMTGSPDLHLLDLSLGGLMNGKLAFEWKRHYWTFWGGELGLAQAEAETPRQAGVYIKGKSQRIDADAWLRALQESPGEGAGLPDFLVRMSGDFGAVDLRGGVVCVECTYVYVVCTIVPYQELRFSWDESLADTGVRSRRVFPEVLDAARYIPDEAEQDVQSGGLDVSAGFPA